MNQQAITFTDLFSLDEIQRLQDEFALATGVASIITTPDGVPITKPSKFCRLCRDIIRKTEKGRLNCYKSDAIIGRPHPGGPTVQRCMSGGLWDAGAGITVEGKHIANWLIGQVRDVEQNPEHVAEYAEEIGVDKDTFLAAYQEVPAMSWERFKNIASMLYTLANQLSSVAYQNVVQTQLISQLRNTEVELRKNQQDLLTSEHRLSIVVDNLPSAMIYQIEVSPNGERRFTYVSENVSELNGLSVESVLADPAVLYNQVHPEDLSELTEAEDLAISNLSMFCHEARFTLPGGEIKWFQLTSSPRLLADGVIVWDGIEIDISDRKKAEEEQEKLEEMLRQSQKIEAIGQLAGGIAHDLNNMLSPIIGYAELLQLSSERNNNDQRAIKGILNAGFKARDLVHQLLAFSRKQTLEIGTINLNDIIGGFEGLLRRTIREDIDFIIDKTPNLSSSLADPSQLEQVLMNLVVNAQDAMPDGGILKIETSNVTIPESSTYYEIDVPPGAYAKMSVSDSGCGITQETKEHIFEPFYSTKGSKGTGLGLATVHGIVSQHNGTISLSSNLNIGTTMSIFLPVSNSKTNVSKNGRENNVEIYGAETILLVEDNDNVLEMTEAILKRNGYSVLTAKDGEQALDIIHGDHADIHLLLTDVVMPVMNGKELFLRAKKIIPSLKVLYMSGYNDDVISHQGMLEEGVNFIQKPFTMSALCRKVREIFEVM